MSLRALALPTDVAGRIWLASMPGRHESWGEFLRQASAAGIDLIVCLTPRHEIDSYAPDYAAALSDGTLPCRWMNLTMRDFGLASDAQAFADGIESIAAAVRHGDSVLLHCAAGIGRTGTAAACVLKRLGTKRDVALASVRAAGSSPESAVQSGLIDRF